MRRARPLYERHLAEHSAHRSRLFCDDEFSVRSTRHGERQVIAVCGQLDLSTAWQLERELRRAEATDALEILVDLAGLEFVDSAGMQVVIHASARAQYDGKRLMIRPGPQLVHRTFERSGFASLLPFVRPLAGGRAA